MTAQGQATGVDLDRYLAGVVPDVGVTLSQVCILLGLPGDVVSRTARDLQFLAGGDAGRSDQDQVRGVTRGPLSIRLSVTARSTAIVLPAPGGGHVFRRYRRTTGVDVALFVQHVVALPIDGQFQVPRPVLADAGLIVRGDGRGVPTLVHAAIGIQDIVALAVGGDLDALGDILS